MHAQKSKLTNIKSHSTVDDYINSFSGEIKKRLTTLRKTIRSMAPDAEECISYGMPAYKLNKKPLVYFAGYEHHIGFYALPTGHEQFRNILKAYKQGRGSVQLPHGLPFPIDLIAEMIQFRCNEVRATQQK